MTLSSKSAFCIDRGFGVSIRLTTSVFRSLPSSSRAATDQRFREDVNKKTPEAADEVDVLVSSKPVRAVVFVSCSASDALIAFCISRTNVGDSSRASWLEVPKRRSWRVVDCKASSGDSKVDLRSEAFPVFDLDAFFASGLRRVRFTGC